MAPTLESLNASVGQLQGQQEYTARQQAAKEAAGLYQQGDVRGAIAALAKVSPAFAETIAPHYLGYDENAVNSQNTGKLKAEQPFESTPGQIAHITADGRIAASEAKAKNAEDKLKQVTLENGVKAFITEKDIKNGNTGALKVPEGQSRTEIGADGNPIQIGPAQSKTLIAETGKFNNTVKADIEAINSTVSSEDITKANVPGSKVAEKVNTLRGLYKSGRVPQQLIDSYMGKDAGLVTSAQDTLTEAEGKGLAPELRQKIFQFNQALQQSLLQQYEAKLSHFSKQVADNTGLDQAVVKRHFAGAGPTPVQQINQQVQKLDPQTQAVFNKAHDDLFSPDPNAQAKAKAVMQIFKQKYGISY